MSMPDPLVKELYRTPRDAQTLALVARNAPVLYFDTREPFLPLCAGYTIFSEDGPSPSCDRIIELRPDDRPAAAMAIEYAIWWDWDIHHLYELEHVWVYLDNQGQPVRVEGSWHGTQYDIPLKLENGRAVLLSEPGKHAFAPITDWFYERIRDYRRSETQTVGLPAHVLINTMFAGKIRQQMFDRVLVRSYLNSQAFKPDWNFSQRFSFKEEMLVPWPVLAGWIPRRVNAWLEHLENNTHSADYRALFLASSDGTLEGLQAAARAGADSVIVPVLEVDHRLILGKPGLDGSLDLDEALRYCASEPMGAFLEVADEAVIEHLAWFVRQHNLGGYVVITATDAALLARYNSFVPGGQTAIQLRSSTQDTLAAAKESGSVFVNPLWAGNPESRPDFNPQWIRRVHAAGLGIVSWPVQTQAEFADLQRMGLDVVWRELPANHT